MEKCNFHLTTQRRIPELISAYICTHRRTRTLGSLLIAAPQRQFAAVAQVSAEVLYQCAGSAAASQQHQRDMMH
jgi:hypothetical protein